MGQRTDRSVEDGSNRFQPLEILLRHATWHERGLRFDVMTFDRDVFVERCRLPHEQCESFDASFGAARWWDDVFTSASSISVPSWWKDPLPMVASVTSSLRDAGFALLLI